MAPLTTADGIALHQRADLDVFPITAKQRKMNAGGNAQAGTGVHVGSLGLLYLGVSSFGVPSLDGGTTLRGATFR